MRIRNMVARHRFELSVDGIARHGATDFASDEKWYVFNFPTGMTGTHEFTGCWYATDASLIFLRHASRALGVS